MRIWYSHFRVPDESYWPHKYLSMKRSGRVPQELLHRYYKHKKPHFDEMFNAVPMSRGGATKCVVEINEFIKVATMSYCSFDDAFSYRVGREIAYGRAMNIIQRAMNDFERELKAKRNHENIMQAVTGGFEKLKHQETQDDVEEFSVWLDTIYGEEDDVWSDVTYKRDDDIPF